MPMTNPGRLKQGGGVPGSEKIDMDGALPVPSTFEVAKSSYDPGYLGEDELHHLANTKRAGYVTDADIKRGFTSYGISIGEGRKDWKKIR